MALCTVHYGLPKQLIYPLLVLLSVSTTVLFVAHLTQIPHSILIIHLDSASSLARIASTHFPRWNKKMKQIVMKVKCDENEWRWKNVIMGNYTRESSFLNWGAKRGRKTPLMSRT